MPFFTATIQHGIKALAIAIRQEREIKLIQIDLKKK